MSLDLRLIPIGSETGSIAGSLEDNLGMTISNAPYGGLGEVVERYLVLACAPLGDRHRRMKVTVKDLGGRELGHFAPGYGFSVDGAYCRGGVIALSGCEHIDVQAELEELATPLHRRYYFACGGGE